MTVLKLPDIVYPMAQVNKINEIVDNLNQDLNFYYTEENPVLTPVEGDCIWTVNHNLGTTNVTYSIYQGSEPVMAEVQVTSASVLTVKINSLLSVAEGTYKIVVIGSGSTVGDPGSVDIDSLNVTPTKTAQTITAPFGTLGYNPVNVAAVTASIDSNIKASNIRKNVDILGVTGTFEGGEDIRYYRVVVVDYDGTILKEDSLTSGETFTLPSAPSHEKLTFQEWSSPVAITSNTVTVDNSDIVIGPVYTTASGLTEVDVDVNTNTGLSLTFRMNGTKDWGDGTIDTATSHTYAEAGSYTVTCDGSSFTTTFDGIFGNDNNQSVQHVRLANINLLGRHAFYCCYGLKDITIPSGVTSIGVQPFRECVSLDGALIIPSGVTEIPTELCYNCYGISYVVFPYGVTTTNNDMFVNCRKLRNITLPKTLTSKLGNNGTVFNNCSSLESLTIPSGMKSISGNALSNCTGLRYVIIEDGMTSIGSSAFKNLTALESIRIPSTITNIDSETFSGCRALKKIVIPSGITSISASAFYNCYSLESVSFPEGLTTIGNHAFYGCASLKEISLPSTLSGTGTNCFEYCYSLETVNISDSNTNILPFSSGFSFCYSLKEVNFKNGSFGNESSTYNFRECRALEKIDFKMNYVGGSTFAGCSSLTDVDLSSNNFTYVGREAFTNCYLRRIKLPNTVTKIDYNAFSNCNGIAEYDFSNFTTAPYIESNSFKVEATTKIKVPAALYDTWIQGSNWSTYVNYIEKV